MGRHVRPKQHFCILESTAVDLLTSVGLLNICFGGDIRGCFVAMTSGVVVMTSGVIVMTSGIVVMTSGVIVMTSGVGVL